jgi:hypothetical protein
MGLQALAKHQSLKTQMLLSICLNSMTNMLLSLQTRPLTISFLCVSHITKTVDTELGIDNSFRNPAYTPMTLHKNERPTWMQIPCRRKGQIILCKYPL